MNSEVKFLLNKLYIIEVNLEYHIAYLTQAGSSLPR